MSFRYFALFQDGVPDTDVTSQFADQFCRFSPLNKENGKSYGVPDDLPQRAH